LAQFISNTVQVHIATFNKIEGAYKHLVLKRSVDAYLYPGLWQVVTGRIEIGEKAIEAALRETKEETGLKVVDMWALPYVASFFNPHKDAVSFAPVFGFLADDKQKVKISSEHEKYDWLEMNDAIERVELPSHKEGIRIFNNYILSKEDKSLFKINLNDFL